MLYASPDKFGIGIRFLRKSMIISIDEFKTYFGIETDDDDEAIELILSGAIGWVESMCSNKLEEIQCVELFDGESEEIFLENTINITEVKVEQFTESSWAELDSSMYRVYVAEGMVRINNLVYGELNYRVSYKAGYKDSVPEDLRLAILKLVGRLWNKRKSDGVKNENLGDAGVAWEEYLNDEVAKVFGKYRKYNL